MMDGTCPFCLKIADKDALPPGEVVWTFPHSVAFLGPWQFYTGYCVLASKRHATELSQLLDDERRGYLDEMALLAKAVERAFQPHKLNYELLGNQVPHLHWHVFPRSLDDTDHLKPVWLALDAAERDQDLKERLQSSFDRHLIADNLRLQLKALGAPSS
jgi:diadenosine tetraphosphate (Ap4A) HIT family hydrolase